VYLPWILSAAHHIIRWVPGPQRLSEQTRTTKMTCLQFQSTVASSQRVMPGQTIGDTDSHTPGLPSERHCSTFYKHSAIMLLVKPAAGSRQQACHAPSYLHASRSPPVASGPAARPATVDHSTVECHSFGWQIPSACGDVVQFGDGHQRLRKHSTGCLLCVLDAVCYKISVESTQDTFLIQKIMMLPAPRSVAAIKNKQSATDSLQYTTNALSTCVSLILRSSFGGGCVW
jgi:hypothetical protein